MGKSDFLVGNSYSCFLIENRKVEKLFVMSNYIYFEGGIFYFCLICQKHFVRRRLLSITIDNSLLSQSWEKPFISFKHPGRGLKGFAPLWRKYSLFRWLFEGTLQSNSTWTQTLTLEQAIDMHVNLIKKYKNLSWEILKCMYRWHVKFIL